jgi:hypothetical protein
MTGAQMTSVDASARSSGRRGRRFKSCHPDQLSPFFCRVSVFRLCTLIALLPLLDGLLPPELHGSKRRRLFGHLASGGRARGRLRLPSLNNQGTPGKLRTRFSYAIEVGAAIQHTIATFGACQRKTRDLIISRRIRHVRNADVMWLPPKQVSSPAIAQLGGISNSPSVPTRSESRSANPANSSHFRIICSSLKWRSHERRA